MNYHVYIILVNYNGFNDTVECINSLQKINNKYDIIIVDNASSDKSYSKLCEKYKNEVNIHVLKTEENLGFAGGNNFGINYALSKGADIFLLLNNDTIVKEDFLDNLLIGYDNKSIVTSMINYYDDKDEHWYCAGYLNQNKCIVENGYPYYEGKVNFASGCCMLLSSYVINQIGLLSEDYFMYYEDVDYCMKAKQKKIDIFYRPKSIIYHKVSKSIEGSNSVMAIYYNNRNRFYIMKKYKLGVMCYLYTYLTRIIKYIESILFRTNNYIIKEAYRDYKKGIAGKKVF